MIVINLIKSVIAFYIIVMAFAHSKNIYTQHKIKHIKINLQI